MPGSGFLAVVLAAGRGKRLRPLTDNRSKATLPVAGKPMVGRVMEMLVYYQFPMIQLLAIIPVVVEA